MKRKLKKCPVCNSSRISENEGMIHCNNCGYMHKERIDGNR